MMSLETFNETVELFNRTFKMEHNPSLCGMLVTEECGELWKAQIKNKPFEDIEGEWADLLFVVLGWAQRSGINMEQAMMRVALKNMEKIRNSDKYPVSKDGKVLKPEDVVESAVMDKVREIAASHENPLRPTTGDIFNQKHSDAPEPDCGGIT